MSKRLFALCFISITLFVGLLLPISQIYAASPEGDEIPWWDDFLTIVQVASAEKAMESNAVAVLAGGADNPAWGMYQQYERIFSTGKSREAMKEAGQKVMVWFEGFGTAQGNVVHVKKNPDGSWMRNPRDEKLTNLFHSHWSWHGYDGTGEIRWIGITNYFENDELVAPWTRNHDKYGCPPMCYPDGTIATGFIGDPTDPRNSRIWDAGCSKDVYGRVSFEYDYNQNVNKINPETKALTGPIAGLLKNSNEVLDPPNPGFTPEEWKELRSASYSGLISAGKDTACPIWIDYLESSTRFALDVGIDGLWVDNYSPWDNFNALPNLKSFGEWSVAGFRDFLKETLRASQNHASTGYDPKLIEIIQDVDLSTFDVRDYLQNQYRSWGGTTEKLDDPKWRDSRWFDDPVWRAFLVYKRKLGTEAFENYYRTVKRVAKEYGRPDFFVSGNDIPCYSLGWIRGELDMVSTELSWGWHLTTGPRGLMSPPFGSYISMAKLGREHAKSRFVNAWYYVPHDQEEKTNLARVVNYQGLANHILPMPQNSAHTLGTPEVNAAFFKFIDEIRPTVRYRSPYDEQIGIYYSSSSQLMEMAPGGFRDHNAQPHSFAFYGWGEFLSRCHYGWKSVPQWKLSKANLDQLKVLIFPNVSVFNREQLLIIRQWVEEGGTLIISGEFATRQDEDYLFATVAPIEHVNPKSIDSESVETCFGKGKVILLKNDPGYDFYLLSKERPKRLETIKPLLAKLFAGQSFVLNAAELPWTIGVTVHQDRNRDRLFVDINNIDIDTSTDVITPTEPIEFELQLPKEMQNKEITHRVLTPDASPVVKIDRIGEDRIRITAESFEVYLCLVVE